MARGNRKGKVAPAPKTFSTTATKLKEITGLWSVSYNFVDEGGPFAWPVETDFQFQRLATFMARLSLLSFEDCMNVTRASTRLAHGPTTGGVSTAAENRLNLLAKQSPEIERVIFEGELTRFTYCYSQNQSERIYGFRLGSVLHLLWWDPKHEVTGPNRGSVSSRCLNPELCHHI